MSVIRNAFPRFSSLIRTMSSPSGKIPQIPDVEIDANGTFKYILIKVGVPNEKGELENKFLVRGYADCKYHTHINDKVSSELDKLKNDKKINEWKTEVLGGGKINHDASAKTIKVYGLSTGYGKADHKLAVDVLKSRYGDYNISWSDEE